MEKSKTGQLAAFDAWEDDERVVVTVGAVTAQAMKPIGTPEQRSAAAWSLIGTMLATELRRVARRAPGITDVRDLSSRLMALAAEQRRRAIGHVGADVGAGDRAAVDRALVWLRSRGRLGYLYDFLEILR